MPNPYFTDTFNPGDYGLTVFQPDMVLKADQLNMLFGYLLSQKQRTRTRLIGVGVVCGLQPTKTAAGSITVSAGCGVTSEGDLLCLESNKTYTEYAPYVLDDHPVYLPFQAVAGLQLWELFPSEFENEISKQPLAGFNLNDKVVLLYLESTVKSADTCTGVACDNKGDAFNNRLHVLLTRQSDAAKLITAEHRQAAVACTRLHVLSMPRVRLDNRPYEESLARFKTFLTSTITKFSGGMTQAYELLKNVGEITPMADSLKQLPNKASQYTDGGAIQYVYDWLKDLFDAYNAFREATCHWLVTCLPSETEFPKHLLLGELVKAEGLCQPQYRHAFIKSPAVAPEADARQKAIWYYNRIGKMLELFEVPETKFDTFKITGRGTVSVLNSLSIMPDQYRDAPLDDRSMPFYYKPEMRAFWSYTKSKHCQTARLLSHHTPAAAPDEIINPFSYNIETVPFYRIERFLGADLHTTLEHVLTQRRQYNLPFEVVALRADSNQTPVPDEVDYDFESFSIDFDDILTQVRCHEPGLKIEGSKALAVSLGMSKSYFQSTLQLYKTRNVQQLSSQTPAAKCILAKLPLLQRLNERYQDLKTQAENRLTFGSFLLDHPGMEHGAGVPRGGTFILVYMNAQQQKNSNSKRIGGSPVVVADFYLPYLCSARGKGMQFVLPEPPPALEMKNDTFCHNQGKEKILASPEGGSFNTSLVKKENGVFYFYPSQLGTHTLTYTAPTGKSVSLEVQVLQLPIAAFEIHPVTGANTGLVRFTNHSDKATKLTWDFGDGSAPVTIKLTGSTNGDTSHTYQLKEDGSGSFEVTLTAANESCSAETKQTVTFEPRQEITLKGPEVVCFNSDNKLDFDPRGGKFTSKTLEVNNDGQFHAGAEGKHSITYTLDDESKGISVFILPGSFELENLKSDQESVVFEAVVITPPKEITYQWQLMERPLEPAKVSKEGRNNRCFFKVPVSTFITTDRALVNIAEFERVNQKYSLALHLLQKDKEICNAVVVDLADYG